MVTIPHLFENSGGSCHVSDVYSRNLPCLLNNFFIYYFIKSTTGHFGVLLYSRTVYLQNCQWILLIPPRQKTVKLYQLLYFLICDLLIQPVKDSMVTIPHLIENDNQLNLQTPIPAENILSSLSPSTARSRTYSYVLMAKIPTLKVKGKTKSRIQILFSVNS